MPAEETEMPAISPKEGPVAVTGASGYISSWIVQDLVEQGYLVHACVRDMGNPAKVDHLLAMNEEGLWGCVELHEGDVFEQCSYNEPFGGAWAEEKNSEAATSFPGLLPDSRRLEPASPLPTWACRPVRIPSDFFSVN